MSSDEQWGNDSFDEQHRGSWEEDGGSLQPKKPGMSTTLKLVIILGCIGGGAVLLCCGGALFMGYRMRPTEDPQEVLARTKEIAEIDIPENFKPQMAMNMNVLAFKMKFVVYQAAEPDGMLMLMSMDVPAAGNQPNQDAQMRQVLQQQGQGKNLTIKKSETREIEIKGEKVGFNFAEAEATDGGDPYRQVTGTFSGKSGTAMLMFQIEEEGYDEAAVVKMLESIK